MAVGMEVEIAGAALGTEMEGTLVAVVKVEGGGRKARAVCLGASRAAVMVVALAVELVVALVGVEMGLQER